MLVTCSIGCTSHQSLILYIVAINIYNITRSNRGTGDPLHSSSAASAPQSTIPDSGIDPSLLDQDHFGATPSSPSPSQFPPAIPTQPSTPSSSSVQLATPRKCIPSISGRLEAAITKASTTISRVPKKRSIEDTFMFMQG